MNQRKLRGQTLVGLLVVIVILLGLAYWFFYPHGQRGKGGEATPVPQAAMERASGLECKSNLLQIRQAIQMYQMTGQGNPPNLKALNLGVGEEFFRCPVGGEPYQYDPRTGKVRCVHPGHEQF
ncbi:MAG TPA: type II secretion system protein [Armatimonadetes bacterium]|nr:type II secretion system protein [Armatimonadota bacterium]